MMRIFLFLVFGTSILWHNLSVAEAWRQDTQLLPPYCKDRVKGLNSPEFTKWRGTFGGVSEHIHHYCSGIYAENKARGTIDQQERKRALRGVIAEMAYVSRHCSAKCVLYPELHSRWGWALAADGQPSEAVGHFQLAIRAKPKYTPAYAKLSDLYLEINQPDEARRVLDEGLKAKPGSSMLQRRLQKLEAP
ncbi:MAG: tetratricopeptide repeat protein [Gammaproteobacteria bacterium]|nr:tetratricopeptide repeat protein [Gammaproteobacteria bacterium]